MKIIELKERESKVFPVRGKRTSYVGEIDHFHIAVIVDNLVYELILMEKGTLELFISNLNPKDYTVAFEIVKDICDLNESVEIKLIP